MLIRGAQVFDPNRGFVQQDLAFADGLILPAGQADRTQTLEANGLFLIPGLVDIHMHGAMGADFTDPTSQALEAVARFQLSQGVTSFLGGSLTLPLQQLHGVFRQAAAWMAQPHAGMAQLRGIYMEGPYFNPQYAGAQAAQHLRLPDPSEVEALFQESGEAIKVLSLAPELPGALDLIQRFSPAIKFALGHSAADYAQGTAAFKAGASLVTHLFNAMPGLHHRQPGLIGAAFDHASFVELISDGQHLHPSIVRAAFQLFGPQRVVLVSDSTRATGMPDGNYQLGGLPVTKAGGTACLANGKLAGSAASLLDCARQALSFGIPLPDVVRAATYNPAKAVGLEGEVGSLEPGKRADLLLINAAFEIQAGFIGGEPIQFQA